MQPGQRTPIHIANVGSRVSSRTCSAKEPRGLRFRQSRALRLYRNGFTSMTTAIYTDGYAHGVQYHGMNDENIFQNNLRG